MAQAYQQLRERGGTAQVARRGDAGRPRTALQRRRRWRRRERAPQQLQRLQRRQRQRVRSGRAVLVKREHAAK
eukprot:357014-Chlamydomonas_euryale.AAC.2